MSDRLGTFSQEGVQPLQYKAIKAERRLEASEKCWVIDGIEGTRKVKKTQKTNFATIHGAQNVGGQLEDGSLGRVARAIGRLKPRHEITRVEVGAELRTYKFLEDLGESGQVGDWAV